MVNTPKLKNITRTLLKKKIQEYINHIEDDKVLEAIYTILNEQKAQYEFELSDEDIRIIEERKRAVKNGEEKLYTLAQVKRGVLKSLNK